MEQDTNVISFSPQNHAIDLTEARSRELSRILESLAYEYAAFLHPAQTGNLIALSRELDGALKGKRGYTG